jgi:SAM-dependent methyltransferase
MSNNQVDWEILAQQLRHPNGDWAIELGNRMNESNAKMNAFLFSHFKASKNHRLLEFGMGNGKFIQSLFAQYSFLNYTGIDYSREMVEESKKNNASLLQKGLVQLSQNNILDYDADKESYDLIFTVNTLYFWDEPHSVFSKVHQLLKPDGRFWVSIRPKHLMLNHPYTKYGFELYNKDEFIELATKNHFKILNTFQQEDEFIRGINGEEVVLNSLAFELIKT